MKLVRSANAHPFRTSQAVINPLHNDLAGRPAAVVGGQGGVNSITSRILKTQAANLIAYWRLGELSGTTATDSSPTAADGTYAGTFTLAQPGIGDGSLSTLFDGTSGLVSLATNLATLDTPFDGAEGSLVCWGKVSSAGVWTDAAFHVLSALGADASNRVLLYKPNTDNTLTWLYASGGTGNTATITASPTGWFSIGITWSKSNNRVRRYYNGVQQGANLTGLGVWAGALASAWSAIGSQSSLSASSQWSGNLAHNAAWKAELTAAEMLSIGLL